MVDTATRLNAINCSGSPFEIGQAHGAATAELIRTGLANWSANIALHERDVDDYLARFLSETAFLPTIERFAPDLLAELQGIADGAGIPFDRILAYNLMDEEWSYRVGKLDEQTPGCTAIAIAGAAIGQTMDIPTAHDGTQVVLSIQPTAGVEKLVFTAAGMLGLNGANRAGVGVVVNNLSQLPSSREGLPVIFTMRGVLDQETAATAADWIESVPHAVGQHYLVGDPTEIISLEGAANGVYRVPMKDHYVHANHPLANLETREGTDRVEIATNTHARAARAVELSASATDQRGLERALEDREAPISCERKSGFMTFGGTSIGLTSPPTVRVSPGPPHETDWHDLRWS